jgi:hypothetical protein
MNQQKKEKKSKTKKIVIYVILVLIVIGIMAVTYDLLVLKNKPVNEPAEEPVEEPIESTVEEATEVVPQDEVEKPQEKTYENDMNYDVYANLSKYANNVVLQCQLHDGLFLNIGLENPDDMRALMFDPKCYVDGEEFQDRYGFYFTSEKGGTFSYSDITIGSVSSEKAADINSFVILNRTLDTLAPASYRSDIKFGVSIDYNDLAAETGEGIVDIIHIRVINLDKGILVGAARAEVSYERSTKTYSITNLYSSDVHDTGEITEDMREYLVAATKAYFSGGAKEFTISLPEDRWAEMMEKATVEVTPKTYFKQLYNIRSNAIRSSAINKYELIAVNIPFEGYVVFTAYFTPQYNVDGSGRENWPQNAEPRQMLIAYDALCPYSKTTFIDNLYPEDVEFFTTYFFDDEEEERNSDVEVVSVDVAEDDAYADGSQVITGSEIVDDEVTVNEPVIIINN